MEEIEGMEERAVAGVVAGAGALSFYRQAALGQEIKGMEGMEERAVAGVVAGAVALSFYRQAWAIRWVDRKNPIPTE